MLVSTLLLTAAAFVLPAAGWKAVNHVPAFQAVPRPLPNPNGYDVAVRAFDELASRLGSRKAAIGEGWRKMPLRDLEAALHRRRATLDRVRAAFLLEWRVPDRVNREGSRGELFREYGRWFAAESRLARSRGDYDAAIGHCLDAVELGAGACRGGDMGDRFVGQDCQVQGLAEAERVVWELPRPHLPDYLARVRRLKQTWPPTTETIEIERQQARKSCIAFFQELSGKPPWEQAAEAAGQASSFPMALGGPFGAKAPSAARWEGWQQALTPRVTSLARLDRFFYALAEASAKPAPNRVPVPELRDLWASRFQDTSCTGSYRGEWPRHNLALLEAALAVRLHRLERGAYPGSLHAIDRRWLPEAPRDVWDQALRCVLRAGRPVVYSIGPDGVDNGGRAVKPTSLINAGKGDAVFGRLCDVDWPSR